MGGIQLDGLLELGLCHVGFSHLHQRLGKVNVCLRVALIDQHHLPEHTGCLVVVTVVEEPPPAPEIGFEVFHHVLGITAFRFDILRQLGAAPGQVTECHELAHIVLGH